MNTNITEALNGLESPLSELESMFFVDGAPFSISVYEEMIDAAETTDRLNSIGSSATKKSVSDLQWEQDKKLTQLCGYAEAMQQPLQSLKEQSPQDNRILSMLQRCNKCLDHIKQVRELLDEA